MTARLRSNHKHSAWHMWRTARTCSCSRGSRAGSIACSREVLLPSECHMKHTEVTSVKLLRRSTMNALERASAKLEASWGFPLAGAVT